jgi:hypothetical protein
MKRTPNGTSVVRPADGMRAAITLCAAVSLGLWTSLAVAQHNPPPQRGSGKVNGSSALGSTYDPTVPAARSGGSGAVHGMQGRQGFRCASGREWAVVEGEIRCGEKFSFQGGGMPSLEGGGELTLLARAQLTGGFSTGVLMRMVLTKYDVRADMFDPSGKVVSRCYISRRKPSCHMGSPGGEHSGLASAPNYRVADGRFLYAEELVSGNEVFAAGRKGTNLQDNYVASLKLASEHVDVAIAGLFSMGDGQGTMLRPVYSRGQVKWSDFVVSSSNPTGKIWQTTDSWDARTP